MVLVRRLSECHVHSDQRLIPESRCFLPSRLNASQGHPHDGDVREHGTGLAVGDHVRRFTQAISTATALKRLHHSIRKGLKYVDSHDFRASRSVAARRPSLDVGRDLRHGRSGCRTAQSRSRNRSKFDPQRHHLAEWWCDDPHRSSPFEVINHTPAVCLVPGSVPCRGVGNLSPSPPTEFLERRLFGTSEWVFLNLPILRGAECIFESVR